LKSVSYLFLALTFVSLSACTPEAPPSEPASPAPIQVLSEPDVAEMVHNMGGATVPVGIGFSSEWILPAEIKPIQFQNAYRLYESVYFGIIQQPNSNIYLPDAEGRQTEPVEFAGIIFTQDNGKTWSNFFEIKNEYADDSGPVHLNPVGMFWYEGRYYVDLADDRGAGSGEGNLLRYWTSDAQNWTRETECYYFNPDTYYNHDPAARPADAKGGFDPIQENPDKENPFELPLWPCPDYIKEASN